MFQALKAGKSRYRYDFPVAIICQYAIILSYKSPDEGSISYIEASCPENLEKEGIYMSLFENKKIAVVGLGGVGGYIGALLADTYPHVSFVARGARKKAIDEHGLILHSDYRGERIVHPEKTVESAEDLEIQDYIFICVKNYSLQDACLSMKNCVGDHTVIVPVMNGADPADRVRGYLSHGTVIDSLIYIVAFANADFSVTQQDQFANLHVGIQNASEAQWEIILSVSRLLNGAGIDCEADWDIQAEIWKKYILNCAYNVETALYDNTIGQLRSDPKKAAEYEALVEEAYQVALAKGIHVEPKHRDAILHRFYYELADNATSSLQRDVKAGRQTELETFSGYIVKESKRLQIPAPVSERMYGQLGEICHKDGKAGTK